MSAALVANHGRGEAPGGDGDVAIRVSSTPGTTPGTTTATPGTTPGTIPRRCLSLLASWRPRPRVGAVIIVAIAVIAAVVAASAAAAERVPVAIPVVVRNRRGARVNRSN